MARADGIVLQGPIEGRFAEILTAPALAFVAALQRQLGATRDACLSRSSRARASGSASSWKWRNISLTISV